jgi:putative ATP-dependent endonuclease of OLD family
MTRFILHIQIDYSTLEKTRNSALMIIEKGNSAAAVEEKSKVDSVRVEKLTINNFRGIQSLIWKPNPNFNVIVGGGDNGKTTILEALALLFSPSNALVLSESDYWLNKTDQEFCIEAVVYLPDTEALANQAKFIWPWEWDGNDAVLLPLEEQADGIQTPVYKFRVRATSDLELIWEIVQPDDTISHLSVGIRRQIGIVKLNSDESNDKDFRLVYGSSLDKLIGDNALRARIAQQVSEIDVQDNLNDKGRASLDILDNTLKEQALPSNLKLGLTGSKGISIGSLIGVLADKQGVYLPLSRWGTGTRRMAALEVSYASEKNTGLVVIDEIEKGLEPYRQRKIMEKLQKDNAQTFITTHSPFVINSLNDVGLWHMGFDGKLGKLDKEKIHRQLKSDPETFLAKSVVIAEGDTEVGFLSYFLERVFRGDPMNYGVRVTSAGGNDNALGLLEALTAGGSTFSSFVDYEGRCRGKWDALKVSMGDHLLQWDVGCLEDNVIAEYDEKQLESLLLDRDGDHDSYRLRTLADRLELNDKSFSNICARTDNLRALILAAATGDSHNLTGSDKKVWKSHSQSWFKSVSGGRELASKADEVGVIKKLEPKLLPLVNSILRSVGHHQVESLTNER